MTDLRTQLLGEAEGAQRQVFVAIPTGQVLANIIPLFEVLKTQDRVVWVPTIEAERQGWLRRSRQLIAGRFPAMEQISLPAVSEYFSEWDEVLRDRFREAVAPGRVAFVANGGTKPLSFAVEAALTFSGLNAFPVIYSAGQPSGLHLQPAGLSGPVKRLSHSARAHMSIDEVLAARGFRRDESKPGTRIWHSSEGGARVEPPGNGYGAQADITADSHRNAMEASRRRRRETVGPLPTAERTGFTEEDIARMIDAVEANAQAISQRKTGALFTLYNTFRKVGLAARNLQEVGPPLAENERIGTAFEQAVAARVLNWLNGGAGGLASQVGEVWTNVSVAREDQSGSAAELDVALVMRNGSVLHLECKSSLARARDGFSKDMAARRMNLLDATGKFSRVFVCMPLYTAFAHEDWQVEIYNDFRKQVADRFRHVFFTLPGQPVATEIERDAGPEAITVPQFEQALEKAVRHAA